jgi:hypothetical protein
MKPDSLIVWVGTIIIGTFLVIALGAAGNCIIRGLTCPPQGAIREILEDTLTLLIGFVAGRLSASR